MTAPAALPQLDLGAVAGWLADHAPGVGAPVAAQKFEGGQSCPTYLLETATGARLVLRRKPPGTLLKSAHAVEREFRVMGALHGGAVPVPRPIALCEDAGVIGSAFFVMEEVAGRVFDDPRLPDLAQGDRRAIQAEMARVLAAIHDVDLTRAGLQDYGPRGAYLERQTARWTAQYRATETGDLPQMDALIAWLQANLPADDGQHTLVHGDFRLDNLIFALGGPQCRAVLDWELSTLGHPFADLAAVIMQWSMPAGPEGRGLAGVDRAAQGLMGDDAFVAAYCAHRGLPAIRDFDAYLVFCHFRMAAILQGVKKRAIDGNASNPERAMQLGRHIPRFVAQGLEIAERMPR